MRSRSPGALPALWASIPPSPPPLKPTLERCGLPPFNNPSLIRPATDHLHAGKPTVTLSLHLWKRQPRRTPCCFSSHHSCLHTQAPGTCSFAIFSVDIPSGSSPRVKTLNSLDAGNPKLFSPAWAFLLAPDSRPRLSQRHSDLHMPEAGSPAHCPTCSFLPPPSVPVPVI